MAKEPTTNPADPCFTLEDIAGRDVVTFTTDALTNPVELERIGHKLYVLADKNLRSAERGRGLVLDFQKVRYFASQAVGILLTLNKKLGRGPAFTLCGVGPELTQLLRITRLDQVLTIATTRGEAVKPG
jgi:anti-anti-sigma factor